MRVQYKLFPYPVLCSDIDDYKSNKFQVQFDIKKDINKIIINFEAVIEDGKLKEMLKDKKTELVYHVECAKTLFRRVYKTSSLNYTVQIEEKNLNKKVDICCFIVAKYNINAYRNDNFNEDYEQNSFEIKRGNILGFYNLPRVEFTKNTEELAKVNSIFSILKRNDIHENGMDIELNGEKIRIWLGNKEFDKYQNFAKSPVYQPMLHAILVLPALIYALDIISKDGKEEYEEYRWFKALEKKLEQSNIILDRETIERKTSYKLAQKLLNLPVNRALKNMTNEEEES